MKFVIFEVTRRGDVSCDTERQERYRSTMSTTLLKNVATAGLFIIGVSVTTLVTSLPVCSDKACILRTSDGFISNERTRAVGANVTLNSQERAVDREVLAPLKHYEILRREQPLWTDLPERELFKFIRRMPKGGDLHIHDMSMVDIWWVIRNLTYLPNLYYCSYHGGRHLRFRFSDTAPAEKAEFCETAWLSVKEKRKEISPGNFDDMLHGKLTTLHSKDRDDTAAFGDFEGCLISVLDLLYTHVGYRPYLKQALTQLYNDNVLYVEIRAVLRPLSFSNGSSLGIEHTLREFIDVAGEFKREHPDFIGAKIIFNSIRGFPKEDIEEEIRLAMVLHRKYPEYMVGYDLVGYENDGPPLRDLLDLLLIPSREGVRLPYFFHVGETGRYGEDVDEDILVAVLLNTTRIGHGYALAKHPDMMELVREKQIPIEVCPVSSYVLSLVSDVRNHPATILLANGFPVVLGSDDPAPWRTEGLSNDFFAAFMSFTRAGDGLGFLKEMSRRGIEFSAMNDGEKRVAYDIWQRRWDQFIDSYYQTLQEQVGQQPHAEL